MLFEVNFALKREIKRKIQTKNKCDLLIKKHVYCHSWIRK